MPHRFFTCLTLLALAAGCNPAPPGQLPEYRWTDGPAALSALCARSGSVKTMSAECALILTRTNGESVRLDGAIVMQLPSSVRLRAWKFSQAVFDLTLTPDGLWIETPPDQEGKEKIMPATLSAAKMARAWSVMSGEFFCDPASRLEEGPGPRFAVTRTIDGQRIICEVDRSTLTPVKYRVLDPDGAERFTLALEQYAVIQGIPWPMRLSARSENGQIDIELKDVELNGELAPNAFVPPRRAQKIP